MSRFLALAPVAIALLVTIPSGCKTTGSASDQPTANAQAPNIMKGSSTDDLLAAMGAPLKIEQLEQPQGVEVWHYEIEKSTTDLTPFKTVEVPYFDPITGVEKTLQEPVMVPQTTTSKTHIRVFVANDAVLGWKVENTKQSEISE